ncbi:winged helix-turn-helix domain-containing protein [Nonomuraea sp. NPDC002799]
MTRIIGRRLRANLGTLMVELDIEANRFSLTIKKGGREPVRHRSSDTVRPRLSAAALDVEPARIRLGDHVIDLSGRTVSGGVRLTPTEWHLLEVLLRHPDKLIDRRRLLEEVWGASCVKETHYLRQYMAQLRRKLERVPARPVHLITEPGMGYRFTPDPQQLAKSA